MTDQADMEARAREWLNGEWQPSVNNFSREDVAQAMVAFEAERGAEREAAAYARAAEVARERMPAVQCMSVEPIVAACEDIATAILALGEAKG